MASDISEWEGFLERILRATERRVGDAGDVESLVIIARVQKSADDCMQATIDKLRADPWNYSWADIALRLGVTRQAVQQRYGHKETYRQDDTATSA